MADPSGESVRPLQVDVHPPQASSPSAEAGENIRRILNYLQGVWQACSPIMFTPHIIETSNLSAQHPHSRLSHEIKLKFWLFNSSSKCSFSPPLTAEQNRGQIVSALTEHFNNLNEMNVKRLIKIVPAPAAAQWDPSHQTFKRVSSRNQAQARSAASSKYIKAVNKYLLNCW